MPCHIYINLILSLDVRGLLKLIIIGPTRGRGDRVVRILRKVASAVGQIGPLHPRLVIAHQKHNPIMPHQTRLRKHRAVMQRGKFLQFAWSNSRDVLEHRSIRNQSSGRGKQKQEGSRAVNSLSEEGDVGYGHLYVSQQDYT